MNDGTGRPLSPILRTGFVIGGVIALALIGFGKVLVPQERLPGVAAAAGIVIVYGLAGWLGAPGVERANPSILRTVSAFGLAAALVYTVEIVLEYALLPSDNSLMGTLEFGTVFLLLFAAGAWMTYQGHRLRDSVLSAVGAALIGALTWLIVVLAVYYLFRGTPQQAQVLRAEGDVDDFARSGGNDFNRFIIEDFMGAAFYHLLLSPLIASALGLVGGLVGLGLRRLFNRPKRMA